mgnify:CR=1 FL=1
MLSLQWLAFTHQCYRYHYSHWFVDCHIWKLHSLALSLTTTGFKVFALLAWSFPFLLTLSYFISLYLYLYVSVFFLLTLSLSLSFCLLLTLSLSFSPFSFLLCLCLKCNLVAYLLISSVPHQRTMLSIIYLLIASKLLLLLF